ncbi:adenosylcobinamide-GDP ribazoletransferase [Agrobacterium rosae]|uniref:adenosylcobinamide-GDP ribazoletransferase n=1 Tax=Agrobacterium rosae TaxID=1972867 RepID=UPI003BA0824B
MRVGDFLTDMMRSLSFLSRIPVNDIFFEDDQRPLGQMVRAFPVAGLLIALPSACLAALFANIHADPLMSAAIVLGVATLITGALHEDGLADTADGFGGGRTKERALDIMKDSRIGTYGAIALVLSFLIRATAIAVLFREISPSGVAAALTSTACFSRGLMVWHWQALPPAREGGIAASAGQPGERERKGALTYGLTIAVFLSLPFFSPYLLVVALAASFAATYLFNRLCARKIDGHTGDTIGATQQITEIVMLVGLALIA